MPKIVFPSPLSNGTTCRATDVQANLDAIKTAGNALDDDNIGVAGLSEVNTAGTTKLFMDATLGHTHDGLNSAGLAAATATFPGGFRSVVAEVVFGGPGFSAELNAGQMDLIQMLVPMWANAIVPGTDSDLQHLDAVPAGFAGASSDLYSSRQIGDTVNTGLYVVFDRQTVPNRVWLGNFGSATKGLLFILGN